MSEVWITGIGLVSTLGVGAEANWTALSAGKLPPADTARLPPFAVHPMPALEWDQQIPRKGDQRQMEPWQRLGVYAAGLALEQAGLKGNAELLARTHMIVAAGGGERDQAVDAAILSDLPRAAAPEVLLNQRLNADLRPTLFLAQLSNLLAGNISIVHGVVGSSRTYMGEEAAGVDAVRIACARARARQGEVFLVGGSYHAERPETLLPYEFANLLARAAAPVWSAGGMALGSVGAFLVLETDAHARARGATPLARIAAVDSTRGPRRTGAAATRAAAQLQAMLPASRRAGASVISGATGAQPITDEEFGFLGALGLPARGTATAWGHAMEPSFVANVGLAALCLRHRAFPPPFDPAGPELAMTAAPRHVLVTAWGHWRGEGMALIARAEEE